jgi:hypothetical protein
VTKGHEVGEAMGVTVKESDIEACHRVGAADKGKRLERSSSDLRMEVCVTNCSKIEKN